MDPRLEEIRALLKSYGIVVEDTDLPLLNRLIKRVELEIKNWCNISEIPPEVEEVLLWRVCGGFMEVVVKNSIADVSRSVKTRVLGDTRIEFATSTDDQNKRIEELKNYGSELLYKYRRIPWP